MTNRHSLDHTLARFPVYGPDARPHVVNPVTESQRKDWLSRDWPERSAVDVVVLGGGISGVAAALAAARRGLDVVVVEPTHMLGGQGTAAGVSAFDIPFAYDHALNDFGIWSEMIDRIHGIYKSELRRPLNVGHYRNSSFTPNVVVVERVFGEMLAEAAVFVARNTRLTGIIRRGERLLVSPPCRGRLCARW